MEDHVIDKLLKSHDWQRRESLEICHNMQTLYSESYFFVINLLPQQESNRLSIWRKKCLTCITPVAIAAIYNLPTGFITLVFGYTSLVISRLYSSFFCRRFTLHFCAVVHWYGAINLIILAIFKSCFVWTLIARDCWQGERHIKNIFELRNFALKPPKFRGTQWLFAVK